VPHVDGVGESGEGLPQWGGQETVSQSSESLHAGKDHPAKGHWEAQPGEGVVKGLRHDGKGRRTPLGRRVEGKDRGGEHGQTEDPS